MPSPLRILLIEDSIDDAELLAIELSDAVLPAIWTRVENEVQLRAALDGAATHMLAYDLVVSDMDLPGFAGLRALQLVRQADPTLPFVMLSGDPGDAAETAALQAGANAYACKQDLARLPALISQALGQSLG